jgi:hypothetical protein
MRLWGSLIKAITPNFIVAQSNVTLERSYTCLRENFFARLDFERNFQCFKLPFGGFLLEG